jgi:hypothetical protein
MGRAINDQFEIVDFILLAIKILNAFLNVFLNEFLNALSLFFDDGGLC